MGSHDPDEIARRRDAAALRREASLEAERAAAINSHHAAMYRIVDLEAEVERLRAITLEQAYEIGLLKARIEVALALHVRVETDESITCGTCEDLWPCPTVKALKGGKP